MQFFHDKAALLFPLIAAALYALAAIALKASSNHGIGTRRTLVTCNIFAALLFLVFYDWSHFGSLPHPLWPVLLLALLFFLGQMFTVLAFSHGEISSVTPVFGVKVIIVSFMVATFIGSPIGPRIWSASVLAAAGIACLQMTDSTHGLRKNFGAMCLAFLAAGSFAGFDTMTQHWSPIMGFGNLVPPAMIIAACFTPLLLIGEKRKKADRHHHAGWFLLAGATLFALQSVVLLRSIGAYGNAPSANVVYGSRGLWGIALVWLVGSWFQNHELKQRPAHVIGVRIVGAILMLIALVLVFL